MKINLIGERRIIMSHPRSLHRYFAWPTVARLGDGRIAVGASGYRIDHICPFGKCVLSFSDDEGETYSIPEIVIDTVLDDRDVGLCTFGNSGLIVTTFNNTMEFQKRVNHRRDDISDTQKAYVDAYADMVTKQEESRALGSLFCISYDNGKTFSPIYKSPVTSPHGPIRLNDGTVLWVGTVFDGDVADADGSISAYKINTEDGTCEHLGDIDTSRQFKEHNNVLDETYCFQLSDGSIMALIRGNGIEDWKRMFTLFKSMSYDGGITWSEPEQLFENRAGAPAHIMRHSSGAIIVSVGYRDVPFGIKVMVSFDDGKTFEPAEYVYHAEFVKPSWNEYTRGCDIGYPSTVELNDGTLLTVFYAYPDDDGAVIMQQRWSFEK